MSSVAERQYSASEEDLLVNSIKPSAPIFCCLISPKVFSSGYAGYAAAVNKFTLWIITGIVFIFSCVSLYIASRDFNSRLQKRKFQWINIFCTLGVICAYWYILLHRFYKNIWQDNAFILTFIFLVMLLNSISVALSVRNVIK